MGTLQQLAVVKGQHKTLIPALLHRNFEENVDRSYGANTALIFDDERYGERKTSYNILNSASNRIAAAMLDDMRNKYHSLPNQDNDYIVAVCMSPSDHLITTLLAIWKAGAAYLPLDPTFPPNRIQHILAESKPALVVYDKYENVDIFGKTPSTPFDQLKNRSMEYSNANIAADSMLGNGNNELALVLYTSGSTGVPKGVRLNHATILNRLEWQWDRFPYSDTETFGVFKTALTFVDSVTDIWGPLLNGLSIVVVPKTITTNPEKLVELLESYKIERLVLVPTLLRSLLLYLPLQQKQNLLYNLKIWVCSGEPLQVSLTKDFFDYFQEGVHMLCNFYGSTEVMGDVTYFVCESRKQMSSFDKVPIGYPLHNTVIYILDPELRPVKPENIGELYVSGLNLAQGYVNGRDPDRFIDNPLAVDPNYSRLYKTGDFASVYKGVVYYEGRTDSQIKIRGHRVDLSEVEKNLVSVPGVEKAMVLCYHAGEIDQALLGFVMLEESASLKTGLHIEGALNDKLPHYMIPQVVILESVPLLVNGKVDRQSLLKMYENTNNNDDTAIELEYDYTGVPQHKMQTAKEVFETIGHVIGRSTRTKISLNSNFYELGGNSLNSIITVTQLCGKGFTISVTTFIGAKHLGEIVDKICENKEKLTEYGSQIESSETSFEYNIEFSAHPLQMEHKEDTIEIITSSFFEKADLEQWLKPQIFMTDYRDILEDIWEVLIEKDLSFIIKDINGKSVGVSLNFDAHDEPEVTVTSKLIIVFEFLEFIEGPIRDTKLPKGINQILHSFMMGTSADLNAQENIEAMHFMESEVLKLARRKQFAGIFTTNTNPLTQQLGSNVYNYETMLDYQVNHFESSDGSQPFSKAPSNQRAIVHWKDIRKA